MNTIEAPNTNHHRLCIMYQVNMILENIIKLRHGYESFLSCQWNVAYESVWILIKDWVKGQY